MVHFEFYFDISSPWTYLAFSRVENIAEKCGVDIDWKPILVGGVFNSVNETVYEQRANPHPIKGRYYIKDLQDWAQFCGIEIGAPPVFPVRAVNLMRAALVALDADCLPDFSRSAFHAYWGELRDVSQPEELAQICTGVGLDPNDVAEKINSDDIKGRLRTNTEELVARGGFGSPTMFINGSDMYFGNDRLPLVEAALTRAVQAES
jgi:2-hydroxychromene-2-carboxylate isomerase